MEELNNHHISEGYDTEKRKKKKSIVIEIRKIY
jgi:hypothetical protein